MSDAGRTAAFQRTPARAIVAALLLGAAVSQAVLDDGGFGPVPKLIFAGLALAALGAAWACDRSATALAARQPMVVTLWLLGIFGAASAAWTVGSSGAALRWGLVTIGYGAVLVASWVVSQLPRGETGIALLITLLALCSGIVGLWAAAAFVTPYANHTTGFWRPAGTLGYSSALSVLELAALPTILIGMHHRRLAVSSGAALAGTVAAIVLALDQSRLESMFAVLICGAALAIPNRTVGQPRGRAAAAIALLVAAAAAAYLVAGRKVSYTAHPHELARATGLGSICIAATFVWTLGRASRPGRRIRVTAIAATLTLTAAVVTLAAIRGDTSHVVYVQNGGFFHGRLGIWNAALNTAARRLLWGHGADSFLISTPVPEPGEAIPDAHDLPLELWVELGIPGFALALTIYWTSLRAIWHSRAQSNFWLFAPASLCFLLADLLDWEWHLAGSGAVWALALGALIARPRSASA